MDFELPAQHRRIQNTVRKFADEQIAPVAQKLEAEHRFPADIFTELADLDLMGVPLSEEYGGLGGDQLMYSLVAEELGRVSGGVGLSYAAHVSLGAKPIERFGTEKQKQRWLRPLMNSEIGSWALTEPDSGSDASDMSTHAERDGDGYRLDGTKQFITNANVANSVLVKAVTDPEADQNGISTFILSPDDGFEVTTVWDKMGLNCSPTCEIKLDDVWLPKDRLLGKEGDGWKQTLQTLDGGRISIAALSTGLARGAYEAAVDHVRSREQVGRSSSVSEIIQKHIGRYASPDRVCSAVDQTGRLDVRPGRASHA